MTDWIMDLHLFEGDGAGAAPAAGGGDGGEAAVVAPGTQPDGTQVDNRLAARMERLAQKRAARGDSPLVGMRPQDAGQPAQAPQEAEPQKEPSLDEEWAELKKGRFKELYARDVKATIDDRFKNQEDANKTLKSLQPMLKALAQKNGVEENNLEELSRVILDDDSLYEEAADQAGMTVEAYRQFKALQDEHDAMEAQREEDERKAFYDQHIQKLVAQAENMRKTFPDFDLRTEMQNPEFFRLTSPQVGIDVSTAYYAVHHRELEPRAMAYGIQRAQSQISQTLQANRGRPTEGAMRGGAPANPSFDVKALTRDQRQAINARVRRGEEITF